MKRSQINTILVDTIDFFNVRGIALPPFATWSPEDFRKMVDTHECAQVARSGLGWLVTDFGLGDFTVEGLVAFTARMGDHRNLASGRGKVYAERHLVQRIDQRTPFHRYLLKTADVINRGQGNLLLRLFHAKDSGDLDEERSLSVQVDGQARSLAPGEVVALRAGESITIEPGIYHEFSTSGQDVLASEISIANDEANDVFFYDPVGVALEIEEDEEPRYLLIQDYPDVFGDVLGKN